MNQQRKSSRTILLLPVAGVFVALSGCMVGPNYHKPVLPVPPTFTEQHDQPSGPAAAPQPEWWAAFQDPTLTGLEAQAMAANTDIRVAVAHVNQADATRRSIGSYRYPTIAAQPQVGRTRYSKERPNNGSSNGLASVSTDTVLPLTLNYEIDAWGRIRRQLQSATDTQQATAQDLQFVRLVVAASVATDYFAIREADAEDAIVAGTAIDLQKGYDVTANQFHRGIISELPVKQAESLLQQAHAQTEGIRLRRAQSEHALAVLAGVPAESFHVAANRAPVSEPIIPSGLPAAMLQRRPDVQAAERQLAATSEQIGVAKAAYYPRFSLTGEAGFESVSPGSLLTWQNTIASLIASASAPIFTGGLLRANVDQARAAYQAQLATYEKTVLSAYADVEDQLAAVRDLNAQSQDELRVVDSARRSEQIATNRYKAGLVSYLDVVFAQQTLLSNEQALAQINGEQSAATVALIRALGGGWQ